MLLVLHDLVVVIYPNVLSRRSAQEPVVARKAARVGLRLLT